MTRVGRRRGGGTASTSGDGGYDAFISYSHADDDGLVSVLQGALRRIAKPWNRRSALDVFCDRTGLSANPGLWSSITDAMDRSRWLVLVASPGAASSPWVGRELGYWLEHRDPGRILVALVAGTWEWDDESGDFDWDRCTAVPQALRGVFAEEPRHIDLRWVGGEAAVTDRSPRLIDQVAEIAAPIHGVTKEQIEGADLREHIRTRRLARSAVAILSVLTIVASIAAVAAVGNAHQARANERRAERALSESDYQRLIAQARDLRRSRREVSLLLAVEARHRRDTPESRGAIQAAIIEDPRTLAPLIRASAHAGSFGFCPASKAAVVGAVDGTWARVDLRTGRTRAKGRLAPATEQLGIAQHPLSAVGCAASADGQAMAVFTVAGKVSLLRGDEAGTVASVDIGHEINTVAVAPNAAQVAVGTADGRAVVWSAADPSRRQTLGTGGSGEGVGVAFSPDGRTLATSTRTEVVLRSTVDWSVQRRIADPAADQAGGLVVLPEPFRHLAFSPAGDWLLDTRRGIVRVFEARSGRLAWEEPNNLLNGAEATFDGDGRSTIVDGDKGHLELRESATGITVGDPIVPVGPSGPLAVGPDGSTLFRASSNDSSISRWALDGRSEISRVIAGADRRPFGVSGDGRLLVALPPGNSVVTRGSVVETASGKRVMEFPTAVFATLLDDGTLAGYFLDELSVDRIVVGTGRRRGPKFAVPLDGAVQASVASNGRVVVGYEDGSVRRFEPDGSEVGDPWVRSTPHPQNIDISPRGDLVGVSYADSVAVFDMSDGRLVRRFEHHIDIRFNSDGSLIGLYAANGDLELREPRTGRITRRVRSDGSSGYFSLRSPTYFVTSALGPTQLFDWKTGRPVGQPFPGDSAPVLFPDGKTLAAGGPQGVVLWDLQPDRWEAAACRMAGRNLTLAEWRTFLPADARPRRTCPKWPPPA